MHNNAYMKNLDMVRTIQSSKLGGNYSNVIEFDGKNDFAEGEIRAVDIGDSISLYASNLRITRQANLIENEKYNKMIQISFCLDGNLSWKYEGLHKNILELGTMESAVQIGCPSRCDSFFYKNQHMTGLNIILDNRRFGHIIDCEKHRGIISDLEKQSGLNRLAVTPKILRMIHQMYSYVPACDTLLPIYLEGKVLELMATYLDEVVCQCPVSEDSLNISKSDYEGLLKAKSIIDARFIHPLTIAQLSKESYMNECKLKKGFKECFGATIYEYIVQKRMQLAKELVESGEYKIKDIAWMVGYSKTGNFITVYQKQFGHTPGSSRKNT